MKNLNRYCGRLLYVYDHAIGRKRTEAECTKEEALKAIRELFTLGKENETIKNLCDKETEWEPGINIETIQAFRYWKNSEAFKHYEHNRREIAAMLKLSKCCRQYDKILDIGPFLGVPPWTFVTWIQGRERIAWTLVKTIEKFGNEDFTIEQLKAEWEVTKNDVKELARIKN